MERIDKIYRLTQLNNQIFFLKYTLGNVRNAEQLNEIKRRFDVFNKEYKENDLISNREKIEYYTFFAVYYDATKDFKKAFIFRKKAFDIFDDNEALIGINISQYITVLNNTIYNATKIKDYNECFTLLTTLKNNTKKLNKELAISGRDKDL